MNILKSIVMLIIFCFSSVIVKAQDGLIHQYKFDGNLEDAVGDSHGVFQDGWWLDPVINNFIDDRDGNAQSALNFDAAGGTGYMIFVGRFSPVQEGVDGEITVTFWGLWHGSTESWQDIINKRDNYDDNMMWGINQHAGTGHVLSVRRRGSAADSKQGMPEGVWTHVAISMDGTNAYFYMNGENYDTQPYEYGTGYNARIHMGCAWNADENWRGQDAYNGALDDVRFYSRVLTPEEILTIYQEATAIEEKPSNVPAQFELAQNFPNPFNPTTTIEYTLAKNTQTEIVVYDLIGNKVATLVDGFKNIGTHKVVWDALGLSAGIYIYQLKTEDFIKSKKMILVK